MNRNIRKLLRTLQIQFPYLLETKFALTRLFRNCLSIPFESDFHALSLFPDIDEALFLDVGANRGQSTDAILMARKNVRLQLFEPNQLLFKKLRDMFGNNEKIIINNFGLGDKSLENTLYIPFYNKWMFDGLASFNEEKARNWLKGRILFFNEQLLSLHKLKCQIKTLDELNLAPYFIKLDIQGYEYQALKGGEQTIKTYEPILLIESPNARMINYLKGFGYQFFAFKKGKFLSGTIGDPNTFFMTESKWSLIKDNISPFAL
jgi:FkbM family methyltransferase